MMLRNALLMLLVMYGVDAVATSTQHLFTHEISVTQGCQRAVERLKLEAIAYRCGAQLSGGSLRVQGEQQDLLDRLYFESTSGYLTRYQELKREVEMVEPLPGESLFRCSVEADLEVRCAQGERDPQFAPLFEQQVALNRIHFKENQEMALSIDPSDPMFITVLQLIPYFEEEQRVWRLYPHAEEESFSFEKSHPVTIPNQEVQWVAQLPEGRSRVAEELVVIATREQVVFPEKMSIEQFHRVLAEIPLSQRRELFIPYQIVDGKSRGELE